MSENSKKMLRYYGTFGPACANPDTLEAMFTAGMTGLRLNTSHTKLADATEWIAMAQAAATKLGKSWELLIDLEGPELRMGVLPQAIDMKENEILELPLPQILCQNARPGQQLLLDDGKIVVEILSKMESVSDPMPADPVFTTEITEPAIVAIPAGPVRTIKTAGPVRTIKTAGSVRAIKTAGPAPHFLPVRVLRGGLLTSRKSIALVEEGRNIEIPSPTLTEHDLENLRYAGAEDGLKKLGVEVAYVMQPFVRSAADLQAVRKALDANGCQSTRIMAKIENTTGYHKLPELLPDCDEVIIARGDLGNAVGLEMLPVIQKRIEKTCTHAGKPHMVVTQMLNSMIQNPFPTRAEVSDIGNAVYCGAASLMLTNETAVGKYPREAMQVLINTAENMQKLITMPESTKML